MAPNIQPADGITISADPALINIHYVHEWLSNNAYWCENIPYGIVKRSITNSLCFGVYRHNRQIGFARVITDQATFAYLADVFIEESYRGRGISKSLIQFIMADSRLQGLRRFVLATRDAHGLYEQFGFASLAAPDRFMELMIADAYR